MKALHLSVLSPCRCTPQRQWFSIFFLSPQSLTQVDESPAAPKLFPNNTMNNFILRSLVGTAMALALVASAQAGNLTWSGGNGSNSDWSSGDNWAGSAPASTDALFFAGSTRLTNNNNLTANTTFNGLTFNSGAGAFVLGGNAITLGGNVTNSSTSLQTINLNLFSNTTRTYTMTTGGGNTLVSGNISGTGGVTLAGTGSLTLNGTNSYSGNTTLAPGTIININSATAIGSGTLITSTGTIDNTSGAAITLSNNNNISFTSNFIYAGSNDLSFGSGAMTSSATRTVTTNGAGVLTIGSYNGSAAAVGLTKSGVGTLAITGAANANVTGNITLSQGTVLMGNKAALGSGNILFSGGGIAASTTLTGANAISIHSVINNCA